MLHAALMSKHGRLYHCFHVHLEQKKYETLSGSLQHLEPRLAISYHQGRYHWINPESLQKQFPKISDGAAIQFCDISATMKTYGPQRYGPLYARSKLQSDQSPPEKAKIAKYNREKIETIQVHQYWQHICFCVFIILKLEPKCAAQNVLP